jgi:hypothetical protein
VVYNDTSGTNAHLYKEPAMGRNSVNPEGYGDDSAEFGTEERDMAQGEEPMFGSVKNLAQCLKESGVIGAMKSVVSTLIIPNMTITMGSGAIRSKGNYYVAAKLPVTFAAGNRADIEFNQEWTIEVDIWGMIRGNRTTYENYNDFIDDQVTTDNNPEDENSLSAQLEGDSVGKLQKDLEEGLKAFLFPWATSASREAQVLYWEALHHKGVIGGKDPTQETPY